jgi:hypothetical protein
MKARRLKPKLLPNGKPQTARCLTGSRWWFKLGGLVAHPSYKAVSEMALKNRLERVEDAAAKADFGHKVAFITYDLAEKPKDEAIAEWEAENGPIAGYQIVIVTSYEPAPVV